MTTTPTSGSAASASELAAAATTDGLPVAPTLGMAFEAVQVPRQATLVDRRVLMLSIAAVGVGALAAYSARALTALIGLVTNVAFYGRFSTVLSSPAQNHLGGFVVLLPVLGGVIVGLMARYGSQAIRGHGIPEAMEQVLYNQSRIAPRVTFLKPLSAAVAIGTGGPFGAEGPIIATGGALGSLVGQMLYTTATERKTLLAAGAAAGMTAIFGSPVSAVLLAVELLLFELRPRSIIPVALACVTAAGVRYAAAGVAPMFPMPSISAPGGLALLFYVLLGGVAGLAAVGVTRLVYGIEDAFKRLTIHWMWWPALGGIVVGTVGLITPHTLGVGYDNIDQILSGRLVGGAVLLLCVMKLISWSVALGSGTSGGTLAPLFTVGGALGAALGGGMAAIAPAAGIDVRIAALVGMAAMFTGASRAFLTSVVFALETTLQPLGFLPLLGGCTAAYLISCLLMRNTIMTEKIARRGARVPEEYSADFLSRILVGAVATRSIVSLRADETLHAVRTWLASDTEPVHHQGFPVVDAQNRLCGIVTRRDLLDQSVAKDRLVHDIIKRPPLVVYADNSLREAEDHMVNENVGRLIVVSRESVGKIIGIVTRSDLLAAHMHRLAESHEITRSIRIRGRRR